jgi:hypothetical protein
MFKNIELLKDGVAICISKVENKSNIDWKQRID